MAKPNLHEVYDAPPDDELLRVFRRTVSSPSKDAEQILRDVVPARSERPTRRLPRGRTVRIAISAAALLLVGAAAGTWWNSPAKAAWVQAAAQVRQVSSFRCRVNWTLEGPGAEVQKPFSQKRQGTIHWAKSGSFSHAMKGAHQDYRSVHPAGQAGIDIDFRTRSFRRTPPVMGSLPSLMSLLDRLAAYRGEVTKDLGSSEIDGRKTHGYEFEMSRIEADASGTVRVWVDDETRRIASLDWEELKLNQRTITTFDHFSWNEPADDWFSVIPPEGFADQTPVPQDLENITQRIVASLRHYARYTGGEYPKVKLLYGDVTLDKFAKLSGADKILKSVSGKPLDDAARKELAKPEYRMWGEAKDGFSAVNTLQRENPDAAYYGKTVTQSDTEKVLFRWKLETGDYQVIFGDLSHRTMPAEELKNLEGK